MRQLLRSAAVVISALAATGCATMTVSSHVLPGLDIAQYRTFDWGPADSLPAGDARLDDNPFFRDRLQGAVEKRLAARGLEQSYSGTSDLLVHYHACVSQRIDVDRSELGDRDCYGADCPPRVVRYEASTLMLEFVDRATNRVIWRGWAQNNLKDFLSDLPRMDKTVDEAVSRMLARFPRPNGRNRSAS
jgi:hypothetical protein